MTSDGHKCLLASLRLRELGNAGMTQIVESNF